MTTTCQTPDTRPCNVLQTWYISLMSNEQTTTETFAADLRETHTIAPNLPITFLRHLWDQNLVEFQTADSEWHVVASDDIVLTVES